MNETITESEVMMKTKDEQKTIATTIMNQIGRRKLYSLRAKNFVALESGVQFDVITRNGTTINRVIVKLTVSDDYTVEFWNINMRSVKAMMLSSEEGIYCDMLGETIMSGTEVEEIIL